MKGLEIARAYFEQDRFATENGVFLSELSGDGAVCTLTLSGCHRNAAGRRRISVKSFGRAASTQNMA